MKPSIPLHTFASTGFMGRGLLMLALCAATAIPHASASVLTPLDNYASDPSGWTTTTIGATSVSFTQGTLTIDRDGTSGTGSTTFWNTQITTDYTAQVIISRTGSSSDAGGVIIGAKNTNFVSNSATNNQGYYLGIVPSGATGGLFLWQNVTLSTTAPTGYTALAHDRQWSSTLATNTPYLLEFSVTGRTIAASLWNVDEDDAKTGSALATLSYTATDDLGHYIGLTGFRFGNVNTSYSFRALEVEAIPEPGTSLSLAAGMVIIAGYLRRRQSRK